MPPEAAIRLTRALGRMDRKRLKSIDALPTGRIGALGDAAALLTMLVRRMQPGSLVVSAFGLREGLIYQQLDAATRAADPLIEGARAAGAMFGRFPEHGDLLSQWIAPLFAHESAEVARLRHAACLLGDVAWAANPELRAERGVDIAINGNWVGVDARGRAMLAHALFVSFGGGSHVLPVIAALTAPEECATAAAWGLAMRLGQRLSGGVAGPLAISAVALSDEAVTLLLPEGEAALYGEAVERRHKQLAAALGRSATFAVHAERSSTSLASGIDTPRRVASDAVSSASASATSP